MRGKYPIGVCFDKKCKLFKASCNDGDGNTINLGFYNTPEEAHIAWKKYKHELACCIAKVQQDDRIARALICRFL